MEGLVALSLACNVVQLVDFAGKAASVVYQTYKSGAAEENVVLERTSQQLHEISKDLNNSLSSASAQRSTTSVERRLQGLASESLDIAEKLQQELIRLKSNRRRDTLWKGLRANWKRDDIKKLEKRLRDLEALLNTGLLVRLREQNDAAAAVQDANFKSWDKTLQQFTTRLAEGHTSVSDLVRSEHETTKKLIRTEHSSTRAHLEKTLIDLHLESVTDDQRLRFLNSLRYGEMNRRKNQISATYPGTFEWIFDETIKKPWPSFIDWLEHGSGVYIVEGKAGSGKSTLMKFIINHQRTKEALQTWSKVKEPLLLSFFFWLSGTPLERNMVGLLSSLLHRLFDNTPLLAIQMLECEVKLQRKCNIHDWDSVELSTLLRAVVRQQSESTPICIFLDGLDDLEKSVKICISSRPEVQICHELEITRLLRLQDLTKADIVKFVSDKLGKAFHRTDIAVDQQDQEKLISEIVDKAEGVFLWVSVALHDILNGLPKQDTFDELSRRVYRLPADMERLYEDMLQRLGEDLELYQQEAALYFRIYFMMCKGFWGNPWDPYLGLLAFSTRKIMRNLPALAPSDVGYDDLLRQCRRTEVRIKSCCAGMLEISEPYESQTEENSERVIDGSERDDGDSDKEVSPGTSGVLERLRYHSTQRVFMSHRSVSDFLLEKPAGQKVLECCPASDFAIFQSLVEARLILWEVVITYLDWGSVSGLLHRIKTFGSSEAKVRPTEVYELLQNIELTLRRVFVSSYGSTAEKAHRWVYALTKGSYADAIDFLGMTLECGLPQYCMYELGSMLWQQPATTVKNLANNYKSYLLLCASSDEGSDEILEGLLDAGADPNAIFYHPFQTPMKILPWINLLTNGRLCMPREKIIERSLASGASLQELTVLDYEIDSWYARAGRKKLFSLGGMGVCILVEVNAAYLMRVQRDYTENQATFRQGPSDVEVPSYRQVLLVQEERVKLSYAEVTSEESASLLALVDRLGLLRLDCHHYYKTDDQRECAKKIMKQNQEICDRSGPVNVFEFLEQRGYYKRPDDPAVLQAQFERFEDLTKMAEASEEKDSENSSKGSG